jgi:hypothetical protein|tara:strand:+ start:232 stop:573 length:342 start_codon:yes stop_codon:yes gene_type:complete
MANESTDNYSDEEVKLSKEEVESRRAEVTAYYKDSIKDLKVQKEYEELLRDIEILRSERVQAQMYLAQAMSGPKEGNPEDVNSARSEAVRQASADWDANQGKAPQKRMLKKQD